MASTSRTPGVNSESFSEESPLSPRTHWLLDEETQSGSDSMDEESSDIISEITRLQSACQGGKPPNRSRSRNLLGTSSIESVDQEMPDLHLNCSPSEGGPGNGGPDLSDLPVTTLFSHLLRTSTRETMTSMPKDPGRLKIILRERKVPTANEGGSLGDEGFVDSEANSFHEGNPSNDGSGENEGAVAIRKDLFPEGGPSNGHSGEGGDSTTLPPAATSSLKIADEGSANAENNLALDDSRVPRADRSEVSLKRKRTNADNDASPMEGQTADLENQPSRDELPSSATGSRAAGSAA